MKKINYFGEHDKPELNQSYLCTIILHLLPSIQFDHEGESDLIWACPLGMPFYLLPDLNKEKPTPSEPANIVDEMMAAHRKLIIDHVDQDTTWRGILTVM